MSFDLDGSYPSAQARALGRFHGLVEGQGHYSIEGFRRTSFDNLIKDFLESFKSQGGLSGPVGNLAGRLQPGWQIPRDED